MVVHTATISQYVEVQLVNDYSKRDTKYLLESLSMLPMSKPVCIKPMDTTTMHSLTAVRSGKLSHYKDYCFGLMDMLCFYYINLYKIRYDIRILYFVVLYRPVLDHFAIE